MKFAHVHGQREIAAPNLAGECPGCGQSMIAVCGNLRVWHWRHRGRRSCDPWWENETEWHRAWKNCFPPDWQEIVQTAESGERHIADVKSPNGRVLEFQRSSIHPTERRSREEFYRELIWVVDGTRRSKDAMQFARAWGRGQSRDPFSEKKRLPSPEGALLRDWSASPAHVFFDFGATQPLWWLYPMSDMARAYVKHIAREHFVRALRDVGPNGQGEFDALVDNFRAFVAGYEPPPAETQLKRVTENPQFPTPQELARRQLGRRFRF